MVSTTLIAVLFTTGSFVAITYFFNSGFSQLIEVNSTVGLLITGILALDALTLVPFAWLRVKEKPVKYAIVKIVNVAINFYLNYFFLATLPKLAANQPNFIGENYLLQTFRLNMCF